jgi:hypothetical protein
MGAKKGRVPCRREPFTAGFTVKEILVMVLSVKPPVGDVAQSGLLEVRAAGVKATRKIERVEHGAPPRDRRFWSILPSRRYLVN